MTEQQLQIQVCNYLKMQYPKLIFFSEPSGMYLKSWQQKKNLKAMRSENGKLPDLFIAEPRNGFSGLFVELKKEGARVFTKKGEPASPHVALQQETLKRLSEKGYVAEFSVGFEQTKMLIDSYLK